MVEGTRRRTQVFEGIVLRRQGSGARETFTVRKQSFGVGVERTFPLHSPKIEKLEVAARGDVRRAKLYYLRGRIGKAARVAERRWGIDEELVSQACPDRRGVDRDRRRGREPGGGQCRSPSRAEADGEMPRRPMGSRREGGAEQAPTADGGAETDAAADTDAEPTAAGETEETAASEDARGRGAGRRSGDSDEDSAG